MSTVGLDVHDVSVSYRGVTAVDQASLVVEAGSCVAVVGANGAGKSSLLRGISGLVKIGRGGRVVVNGVDLTGKPPSMRARQRLGHVLEGRHLFPGMTVRENLELSALLGYESRDTGIDLALSHLPELEGLMERKAETLSGGQQQFVAIARSLAANPSVLMLDEPTNGLAPRLVDRVIEIMLRLRDSGIAVLLIEQRLEVAQRAATEVCVFSHGRVVATTAPTDPDLASIAHDAYLS